MLSSTFLWCAIATSRATDVAQNSVSEQKVSWRSSALTNPAIYPIMHCAYSDPKVGKVSGAWSYFLKCLMYEKKEYIDLFRPDVLIM